MIEIRKHSFASVTTLLYIRVMQVKEKKMPSVEMQGTFMFIGQIIAISRVHKTQADGPGEPDNYWFIVYLNYGIDFKFDFESDEEASGARKSLVEAITI